MLSDVAVKEMMVEIEMLSDKIRELKDVIEELPERIEGALDGLTVSISELAEQAKGISTEIYHHKGTAK